MSLSGGACAFLALALLLASSCECQTEKHAVEWTSGGSDAGERRGDRPSAHSSAVSEPGYERTSGEIELGKLSKLRKAEEACWPLVAPGQGGGCVRFDLVRVWGWAVGGLRSGTEETRLIGSNSASYARWRLLVRRSGPVSESDVGLRLEVARAAVAAR